ncbi:Centromere protein X, partial [Stegodyphus mimosarum]
MAESNGADFPRQKCVEEILKLHFKNSSFKITSDAGMLVAEIMRNFIKESAARAVMQAKCESNGQTPFLVTAEHVEKILPQILLDF